MENIFGLKGASPAEFFNETRSVSERIKACMESNVSVFLHGKPGVGKSQRVLEIDPDAEVLELSLTPIEELMGVPIVNENNETETVPPEFLTRLYEKCEKEPDKLHILFLDELTNADDTIQGLAYSLILERKVNHKWPLPDNVRVVAAGNEVTDSIVATEMPDPLKSRLAHIDVEIDYSEWKKWALEHNIDEYIIKFLDVNFSTALSCETSSFAVDRIMISPRTWERASKTYSQTKSFEHLIPILGDVLTEEFANFTLKQHKILKEHSMLSPEKDTSILRRYEKEGTFIPEHKTASELLQSYIDMDIPVFLHGKQGEGKSDRVKQIDPNCTVLELSLTSIEDMQGLVLYDGKKVVRTKPEWMEELIEKCEKEPDKIHVLFLDELTNADPSIQKLAYSIVLNKRVANRWKLPDNVRIVAAGNEIEDSSVAEEMPEPLKDRFAHLRVDTTIEEWIPWAIKKGIESSIISFISSNNYYFKTEVADKNIKRLTPRTWERASKLLKHSGDISLLSCIIGQNLSDSFEGFITQPSIEKIKRSVAPEDLKDLDAFSYVPHLLSSSLENLRRFTQILLKMKNGAKAVELLNQIRESQGLPTAKISLQTINASIYNQRLRTRPKETKKVEYVLRGYNDTYVKTYIGEVEEWEPSIEKQKALIEQEESDWDELIGRYGRGSIIRNNGKKSIGKTPRKYSRIKRTEYHRF